MIYPEIDTNFKDEIINMGALDLIDLFLNNETSVVCQRLGLSEQSVKHWTDLFRSYRDSGVNPSNFTELITSCKQDIIRHSSKKTKNSTVTDSQEMHNPDQAFTSMQEQKITQSVIEHSTTYQTTIREKFLELGYFKRKIESKALIELSPDEELARQCITQMAILTHENVQQSYLIDDAIKSIRKLDTIFQHLVSSFRQALLTDINETFSRHRDMYTLFYVLIDIEKKAENHRPEYNKQIRHSLGSIIDGVILTLRSQYDTIKGVLRNKIKTEIDALVPFERSKGLNIIEFESTFNRAFKQYSPISDLQRERVAMEGIDKVRKDKLFADRNYNLETPVQEQADGEAQTSPESKNWKLRISTFAFIFVMCMIFSQNIYDLAPEFWENFYFTEAEMEEFLRQVTIWLRFFNLI